MAKARVELVGSLTYDARGRNFTKGQSVIIDSDGDIAYYKAQPEFTVTMLKEVAPAAAKPAAKAEATEPPEPPPSKWTADELNKRTKTDLINLAAGEPFNLALNNEMKKPDMVEAMMAAIDGDDGDDDEGDDSDD